MKGVSVILTTYNGKTRGYIQQSIESVLAQSHREIELIIVDDGSTDATPSLCERYLNDHRVSFISQDNKGPGAARNTGIRLAKYDYVTFLDDDDFYEPKMIEKMYHEVTNHSDKNIGMVYCRTRHIDSEGKVIKTPLYDGKIPVYEALFYGNMLSTPAVIIWKEVFNQVGSFCEQLMYAEDYDLWFRISKSFEVLPLDDILVNIRVHGVQLSSQPKKMELYHSLVLHRAIEGAVPSLSNHSDSFYYLFYTSYMKIYLGMHDFKDFRRMLLSAKEYGPISLKWRLKYWLSYTPKLFISVQKLLSAL